MTHGVLEKKTLGEDKKKTSAKHEEGQFLRLAEADPLRKTG
jgi:hypothetical protein